MIAARLNKSLVASRIVSSKQQRQVSVKAMPSRRELLSALALVPLVAFQAPAQAGLFEFGGVPEEVYRDETNNIIALAKAAAALPKGDPALEETVNKLRKEINTWVAKYRRNDKYAGRPSFSNLYSALSAMSGHYNSFGPTSVIPKKRLDRIVLELDQASTLVQRGR